MVITKKDQVFIQKLYSDVKIPTYATSGSACFDFTTPTPIVLHPRKGCLVHTGLKIKFSDKYVLQIYSRSGMVYNFDIVVLNAPAIIDSDYNGEIKIMLYNVGNEIRKFLPHTRIAQGMFIKKDSITFEEVPSDAVFETTERNDGGFGSTGVI